MNNCTLYFAEADSRSVAQQSHGYQEHMTPSERASILAQHEC